MVQAYADWCTLPTIQWAVANALKSVKAQDSTSISASSSVMVTAPRPPGVLLGAPPPRAPLASMGGKELVPR
jgi:hypothetical protein